MKKLINIVVKLLEHNPEHGTKINVLGKEINFCSRCLGMYTSAFICYFLFAYIYLYTNISFSFWFVFFMSAILGSVTLVDWVSVSFFNRKGDNKIRIIAGVLLGVAGTFYFWLLPESWLFKISTLIFYLIIAIMLALVAIWRKKSDEAQADTGVGG